MEGSRPVEMDREGIDAFLGTGGTCVLALAQDGDPYAVPVSYAYDPAETVFFLRLGDIGDSEKGTYVETAARARLVVYDIADAVSASVIADGELVMIDSSDLTPELIEVLSRGEFPHFELWPAEKSEVEFTIAQLTPTALTGRRSRTDDE